LDADDEQISVLSHTEYEIWSPYDSADAANMLLQLLEEPTHDLAKKSLLWLTYDPKGSSTAITPQK
jgi:hypothetical protein